MLITARDKQIFKFIEKYKAISSQQAKDIFFQGLESSTSRRLTALERSNTLTSYQRGYNKVYTYNEQDHISSHDLGVLDFYAWIMRHGGEVIDFQRTPHYFRGLLIPDALVKFKYPFEDKMPTFYAFLEYDLNHYTENTKIATWYTKLWRENVMADYCGKAEFPILIIARPTEGVRYQTDNFDILYTDLKFTNLDRLLI